MPKLKQSASDKHQYSQYKSKFEKNKLAKLRRLAKSQPNNKPLQARLEKALDKGIRYIRNRKSNGHTCKGMYSILGFVKNQPNGLMLKSKLGIHWYSGGEYNFNHIVPNHGKSMCEQFEALGYEKKKRYVRKYKKTAR